MPPFDLSDLPQLLREDVSLQHSKEEIIQYFHEHTDEIERANYLKEVMMIRLFKHSGVQNTMTIVILAIKKEMMDWTYGVVTT